MKTFPLIMPALSVAMLLTSCGTLNTGAGAILDQIAERIGEVAHYAVVEDLKANPGHRAAYNTAVEALNGLILDPTYSAAKFKAVLRTLPINELRDANGTLQWERIALDVGVAFFGFVAPIIGYQIESNDAVAKALNNTRDGIVMALEEVPPQAAGARPTRVPPPPYKPITPAKWQRL